MDKLQHHREQSLKYYYQKVKPRNELKTKKSPGKKPSENPNNRQLYLRNYMRDYYKKNLQPSTKLRGRPRKYQTEEEYLKARNEAQLKFKTQRLSESLQ